MTFQVMEEGGRLSKKQLTQENTIKKLRAELTELRSEKGSTSASLLAERQKVRLSNAAHGCHLRSECCVHCPFQNKLHASASQLIYGSCVHEGLVRFCLQCLGQDELQALASSVEKMGYRHGIVADILWYARRKQHRQLSRKLRSKWQL